MIVAIVFVYVLSNISSFQNLILVRLFVDNFYSFNGVFPKNIIYQNVLTIKKITCKHANLMYSFVIDFVNEIINYH